MRLLLVVSLFLVPAVWPIFAQAQQSHQLPADLIFLSDLDHTHALKTLLRVDALTLQWTAFYTDETASISPIAWSPQGKLLAVRRNTIGDRMELCLITRFGQLRTCLADTLSDYAYYDYREEIDTVTWSADGQHVYFIAEQERVLSVMEANTLTGQTIRTIYRSPEPYYEWVPLIHWSPNLDYLAVYESERPFTSDFTWTVALREGALINLHTGEHIQLHTADPQLGSVYFCEGFSPQGTYLTVRTYAESEHSLPNLSRPTLTGLALLDHAGELIPVVDGTLLAQHQIDWAMCPTWTQSEDTFYFQGGTWPATIEEVEHGSIFKFTLSTRELVEVRHFAPHEGPVVGPLMLSPEENTIAFPFGYPHLMMSDIAVLLLTGEIVQFDTPSSWAVRPLWVPRQAALLTE